MMKHVSSILAFVALCCVCTGSAFAAQDGVWPLQTRIDEIAAKGGGTLVLTAGEYHTGAIFFKPGVNLHLEKGATIIGVDDAEGYPMRETRIEGETCQYYPALVNADGCDGFKISGEGVIDGHGANTWEEFWTKRAAARKKGGDLRNKDLMRPRVLYVSRSKNVDISGVTFKNSKFWTTHFYDCEDVVVHDCSILADVLKDSKGKELKGPSTDAIDIDKCRRFTVRNVDISVNDDGVVVKGGKGAWADDYTKFPGNGPSTDVLVENCTFRYPTHSALTLGSECPAATNVTMRGCTMDGCGNMLNLKMRTDTPQHYANVLVENCRGKCSVVLSAKAWRQYHNAQGRSEEELKSFANDVTLRNNMIEAPVAIDMKRKDARLEVKNLNFDGNVLYQTASNLPLKHDGYVVEKWGQGSGGRSQGCNQTIKQSNNFLVKAATRRAFLYANYESNRWMNAPSYPFVRDPHFKFRGLDVSRSPEPLKEWIAATGANAVYLKRGRPDAKLLRECAELGVPAYGFLYGCDAAKWSREKYDEFIAAHPSSKGVTPQKSWEKGTMCPSDPATREFFAATIREIAESGVAGVVVCLWDDYGLNCVCDRCKANGFAGNWGWQVAFAVKAWEDAVSPLGKELIVRTWASGASHWLGEEWVHAPGYGGESGEPLSVWGEAMRAAGKSVKFQTKVYNADCQPDPPFSALLQVAPRREIAEWQITGQTVGLQYLPASVVDQTARQMRRVAELVSPEDGVMMYAGSYKRNGGYAALSDDLNSVNVHVWRQLSWNPTEDVESLWREWAVPRHGTNAEAVIAAMKSSERATVAAFSPLGLGAPTESFFAKSAERRESLLRYTNRFFLPEGIAALAPTKENIARVIAEKDAALAQLKGAGERFDWLRAQLKVSRALDGALWRYFHMRECAKEGRINTDDLSGIEADFETVRSCVKDVCPGLGSPIPLMRDIRDKARQLVPPPERTAAKLAELFLSTSPDLYKPQGYRGGKAYGGSELVHYSVVSLWVNALECAHIAGDTNLVQRLVAAFEPAYGAKKIWMNDYRHVDLSIVGAIPLEIAILTGDKRAKELGLMYADRQWEEPREGLDWGERWYDAIPLADRHANWKKGFTPETRLWIDDMYMVTFLQSQAYRLTGDRKYIERAGKEMCMYLEKLQRPDGLFDHAPGAPFAWGRGNGWMAAAMAMNLRHLPADSKWRAPILKGYRKMMSALLKWQRPNGLWGQLVNDPESYDETSATAMFAYAFAEGAKAGVLNGEYKAAVEKAYAALVARLDEYGNLPDVCVGTGWKNDRHHYLTRPRCIGDPHGQAPLLWLCGALMRAE